VDNIERSFQQSRLPEELLLHRRHYYLSAAGHNLGLRPAEAAVHSPDEQDCHSLLILSLLIFCNAEIDEELYNMCRYEMKSKYVELS